MNVLERFMQKVDTSGDCWIWLAATYPKGYGRFSYNGKTRAAHRVSYTLHVGEIPDGMHVLHTCDVPSCVNPAHLWLGTNADNMRDRDQKGRQVTPLGSKHGQSKLTEAQVFEILADNRTQRVIAADYGVSRASIGAIKRCVYWQHVTRPSTNRAHADECLTGAPLSSLSSRE